MTRHLKSGRTPEQTTAEAKKVRDIVTGILEDIESRGETALREISKRFDKWNPPAFRLSEPPDVGEPHVRAAISNWFAVALFAGAAAYYFLR